MYPGKICKIDKIDFVKEKQNIFFYKKYRILVNSVEQTE